MSKVDAQRAMREARYARNNASGPTRREAAAIAASTETPRAATPSTEPTRRAEAAPPAAAPPPASPGSGLCGHKSMNGRACTREAGHSQKSHRYS